MMKFVYRSPDFPGTMNQKSFHNTQKTILIHNHFAIQCFSECVFHIVNNGHLQHYRQDCQTKRESVCAERELIRDTTLWRYKETVIRSSRDIIHTLDLLDY